MLSIEQASGQMHWLLPPSPRRAFGSQSVFQGQTLQVTQGQSYWLAAGLVAIGIAWFLFRVRGEIRRFRGSAQPLIDRARTDNALQKLRGKGIDEIFHRAHAGDAAAQYTIASSYASGEGLPRNAKKALLWYEKAANGGFVEAQYCLGLHYEHGRGVPRNLARALDWYEKSASKGYAAAQCNLGVMYLKGLGVAPSLHLAIYWLVSAMARGNAEAAANLRWLVANYASFPQNAEDVVAALKIRADGDGDMDALLALGWLYDVGLGVQENKELARRYYERAQTTGDIFAYALAQAGPWR